MSSKYSKMSGTNIEYGFWLIFDSQGGVRFSRGNPTISRDERRILLTTTLPKSIFREPELKAIINVPENDKAAMVIDIEVAADALQKAIGCDIDIQVIS